MLRKYLDDVPLWRGEHVAVSQLVVDFARYLYLPRLVGPEVLVTAMRDEAPRAKNVAKNATFSLRSVH